MKSRPRFKSGAAISLTFRSSPKIDVNLCCWRFFRVLKIGCLQWPASVPGDARRDFVTVSADYIDKPAFMASVTAAAKSSRRDKVLVFVHGFKNRFDDAVYRFAQIVHDSKTPAVPVLFTWPSRGELRLRAYTYDRESANYSRDALEELLDALGKDPGVSEIDILAHSMGNWVALEALRSRYIRSSRATDKIKNVMLVAPDVDVDVFRTQICRMGAKRPRFALFVSQDDRALALSRTICGGMPRLGEVNPEQDPYRSELAQEQIEVFDLTSLRQTGDNAHDRAFEDVTSVVGMIKQCLRDGQQMTDSKAISMVDRRVAGLSIVEEIGSKAPSGSQGRKRVAQSFARNHHQARERLAQFED